METLISEIEAKLHENNQHYTYYPSDYVLGLLSDHSYQNAREGDELDIDGDNPKLFGWKVAKVFQEAGYFSVLYVHEENGQLVLAHRGSNNAATWGADAREVVGNFIDEQLAFAYDATQRAVRYAAESDYHLAFTGHSLGGWLAELSVYFCTREFHMSTRAVTFDSPGSLDMMEALEPNIHNWSTRVDINGLDIVTYLTAPHIINSCHEHVGTTYRVFPELSPGPVPEWLENLIEGHMVGQFAKAGWDVYQRHHLRAILDQFDPETELPREYAQVLDWPKLDYTPPTAATLESKVDNAFVAGVDNIPLAKAVPDFVKRFVANGITRSVSDNALKIGAVLIDLLSGKVNAEQYWGVVKAETHSDGRPVAADAKGQFYLMHRYHYDTKPVI